MLGVFLLSLVAISDAAVTRFAYAVNAYDASVTQYTVDAETGRLRHNGWVPTGKFPSAISTHPTGKYVYIAEQTGQKISAFQVDPVNGRLNPVAGSPFDSKQTSPFWLAVDPSGSFVFIAGRNSNNLAVMKIDPLTGALSAVTGSPWPGGELPRAVAVHPSGRFVYMTSINHDLISAYEIDSRTGKLKLIPGAPFSSGDSPQFMRFHPNGRWLYVSTWNDRDISVYQVNTASGALEKKNRFVLDEGAYPFGVGMNPDGRFLYVANWFGGTLGFKTNADRPELERLPDSPYASRGGLPVQVEVEPTGKFAYVTNFDSHTVTHYALDNATGALSVRDTVAARIGPRHIGFVTGEQPVTFIPRALYVANAAANQLSALRIDAQSGRIEPIAAYATGARPGAVTIDPLGRFVFVANEDANTLSVFAIQSGGALSEITGSPFKSGKQPIALATDSNGAYLYVGNRGSKTLSAYEIHPQTGKLTELTHTDLHSASPYPTTDAPIDLVVHPADRGVYVPLERDGKVTGFKYYDDGVMVVELSAYGAPYTLGKNTTRIAWEPGGRFLYSLDANANQLDVHSMNELNAALRDVDDTRPVSTGKQPVALAFHPNARLLYVLNRESEDISLFNVDPETAVVREIPGRVKTGKVPVALTVDGSGRYLYVANSGSNNVSVYSIDRANGKLALLTTTAVGAQPVAMAIWTQVQ